MTEEQLVDSINRGELEAFRQLYKEFYPSLCIYAKNFTRNKEIAEEVVQDVFISIWERKGHLNIESSFKSFLFVSVRNGCLNHLKHLQVINKFNVYYTQLLKDAQELFNVSQETGDSLLFASELEEKILKVIESLPEKCRRIFIMSRFDCLGHQGIADKLGVSINTVHRQTSIALEKLRSAVKNYLIIFLLIFRIFVR